MADPHDPPATPTGCLDPSDSPDRFVRPGQGRTVLTFFTLLMLAMVVFGLVISGLWLRDQVWNWTYPIRFQYDVNNGFRWGVEANRTGYFSLYERIGPAEQAQRRLDYAPLRLGVMTGWVYSRKDENGTLLESRQPTLEFHRPVLMLNSFMGLTAAIGAFLIAREVIRWKRISNPTWFTGTGVGLVVATLVWLNPLVLLNAHAWPQWDIWPMPFFLFAVYACFKRFWLTAGLLLGVGATLKGQILMVAWVFPVYALLLGDWRGAIRLIAGIAGGILFIGLPWILTRMDPEHPSTRVFDLFQRKTNGLALGFITVQVLIFGLASRIVFKRYSLSLVLLAFASSAWLSMKWFGGTDYWLQAGFGVGTWNYPAMYMGTTSNLPALLSTFGWRNLHEPLFEAAGHWITMRTLLLAVFTGLCLICAVGSAVRYRQRDPRAVIGLCLPWLFFYAIPGQIHERYLLYFVTCAPLFLVAGWGWLVLGGMFVLLGFVSTIHTALLSNRVPVSDWSSIPPLPWEVVPVQAWGFIRYLVEPTHPGIAWALLMGLAVATWGFLAGRSIQEV